MQNTYKPMWSSTNSYLEAHERKRNRGGFTSTNELPPGFRMSQAQKYPWLLGRLSSLILRFPKAALMLKDDGKTLKHKKN